MSFEDFAGVDDSSTAEGAGWRYEDVVNLSTFVDPYALQLKGYV